MTPAEFPQQTMVIAKNQPEYLPLPAHYDSTGVVTFLWQLTWRERLQVLVAGRLWHQVWSFGRPLQPVKLSLRCPLDEPAS